jgi:hypothetical protein
MDEVTELADLWLAQYERGEDLDHLEFRLRWAALTDEERDQFMALMEQRIAQREERREAIESENRALEALLRLNWRKAPRMSLPEAIGSGRISVLEVVRAIAAVPV